MPNRPITVVISQAQGKNPVRRQLEEEIAAELLLERNMDVSLVPHLYDLDEEHTGTLFLRSVPGDLVVLAWLYPRATRWILDRLGVKGHEGRSLLNDSSEDDSDHDEANEAKNRTDTDGNGSNPADNAQPQRRGIGSRDVPPRRIYAIDLRSQAGAAAYIEEVRRIAREASVQTVELMQWIGGSPRPDQLQRFLHPAGQSDSQDASTAGEPVNGSNGGPRAALDAPTRRRWYPVIDYDRCTNCMECIDFCLFGVYGVDELDRILVEEQDNCKKGCPACSRVCPENAIIFPGHKSPAIAGADVDDPAGVRIDLSKLFGGGDSALEVAVQERDRELIRDGRAAVGMSVGIPKRRQNQPPRERDELDDLMDGLDELD